MVASTFDSGEAVMVVVVRKGAWLLKSRAERREEHERGRQKDCNSLPTLFHGLLSTRLQCAMYGVYMEDVSLVFCHWSSCDEPPTPARSVISLFMHDKGRIFYFG